jgi:ABC-2 type transport system permease protein
MSDPGLRIGAGRIRVVGESGSRYRDTTAGEGLAPGVPAALHFRVFAAMLVRDLLVLRRNLVTVLIGIVAQPLLFAFIFGYLLPRLGGLGGGGMGAAGAYPTVLLPGLLATVLVTQSLTAVAGPLIVELANPAVLRNRLLAPVPAWLPLAGRAASGAVRALLATGLMFPVLLWVHPAGQAPSVRVADPVLLVAIVLLAPMFAAALGLCLGTWSAPKRAQLVNGLVLLPLSFLGCVYYPHSALAGLPLLRFVSLLDPVTYLSESLRAALTPGVPHLPPAVTLPALLGGALLAGYLGMLGFTRRTQT